MKNRLISIIQQKQMNAAQFADAIGIQRSTLHHILSGRNNPSLDVVMKIHAAYPDIDLEWLISGNGSQQETVSRQEAEQQELFPDENRIFRTDDGNSMEYTNPARGDEPHSQQPTNSNSIDYNKKITKIILVYSDGTTEFFNPGQN